MTGNSPSDPERDLARLLRQMRPMLDPVVYAFCRLEGDRPLPQFDALGLFRESEGLTCIIEAETARRLGLVASFLARRITLAVYSDLRAVGFLARVAQALADAGIACNVLSAVHHDYLFVPSTEGERALELLQGLQRRPAGGVLYEVTVQVDREIADEWLSWMERVHVPEVLATGCFESCSVTRVLEPDGAGGRMAFALVYRAPALEACRDYQAHHAPRLQRHHAERYAGRFEASRRLLELRGSLWPGPP
jgi:hypothetical protein